MQNYALILTAITLAVMRQARAFLGDSTRIQLRVSQLDKRKVSFATGAPQLRTRDTKLFLDLFGLGPSEIVIVVVVAGLLRT